MCSEMLHDLGLEEAKYTHNNSEPSKFNALVKHFVNFKMQDILKLFNDLKEHVREQQNELNKATIGLGRWALSPSYAHLGYATKD